jgi:cellobiose phosphorylase
MMAYAHLNQAEMAYELFSLINPINRSSTFTGSQCYKVEPYVICADIYGVEPHIGRGGWSWYTGSASWMYRASIESIIGLKIEKNSMRIEPCIPKAWDQFEVFYKKEKTTFKILVLNNQTEASIEMDGKRLESANIPLNLDNLEHRITVNLISKS